MDSTTAYELREGHDPSAGCASTGPVVSDHLSGPEWAALDKGRATLRGWRDLSGVGAGKAATMDEATYEAYLAAVDAAEDSAVTVDGFGEAEDA